MQVDIVPSGSVNLEMMRDLGELCDELQAAGLDAQGVRASLPGIKDGGLTVAIALVGLAFSSVSSLVSVLNYFSTRKPKYSISMEADGSTVTISQLDAAGIQAALKRLEGAGTASPLLVRVFGS